MQVVRATRFGGPEVLESQRVPDPVPGPHEVVVDVAAADTLFLDVLIRQGRPGPWTVHPPYVPGAGIAGQVSSVGDGVDPGWVGTRVTAKSGAGGPRPDVETIARAAARTVPTGGYAERAVSRVPALVPVPAGLDLLDAAALVNDGLTAVLLAEAAQVEPSETVLVTPAGGGLGSLLVQLARDAGGHVIAGAGSPSKLARAAELGADVTVDYSEARWTDTVRAATGGRGADVVLDGVGGEIGRASLDVTATGGRFVAFGAPSGTFTAVARHEARERQVTVHSILDLEWTPADERRLPADALALAAAGRIAPVIGRTHPLDEAATAHAAMEDRAVTGKTLLVN